MHDGDLLTDSRGAAWVLDAPLGRGLWGRCRVVRGEDGTFAVLKAPLIQADFGDRPDAASLADACRRAAAATAALYEARAASVYPSLLATVALPDGREGLLLRRYPATLESRLAGGMPLAEAIDVVLRTLHRIATASATEPFIHGDLRPSNILLDDEGHPVLADPLVAPIVPHLDALTAAAHPRTAYLPPEASGRPRPGWDTWASCAMLYRAAMLSGRPDHAGQAPLPLPREGLGRVALAEVQDASAGRLRAEKANRRFASRAVRALGRILNRGLSLEPAPSPPYRFEHAHELRDRLVEVDELIHPHLTHVGPLQLGPESRAGVFEGGQVVSLSVNVAATRGVDAEQDVVPGVALRDLDAPGGQRVKLSGSRFRVQSYPTGRYRFRFELLDVPPGRYEVEVAFGLRDAEGPSDAPLRTARRAFEVRPKPGYIPSSTPDDAAPTALPMRAARDLDAPPRAETTDEVPPVIADIPRPEPLGDVVAFPEPRRRVPRPVPPPPASESGAYRVQSAAHAPRPLRQPEAGETARNPVEATDTRGPALRQPVPTPALRPTPTVRVAPRADGVPVAVAPPLPAARLAAATSTAPASPPPGQVRARVPPPARSPARAAQDATTAPPVSMPGVPRVRVGAPPAGVAGPPSVPVADPSGVAGSFDDDLRDDPFDEGRDLPDYDAGWQRRFPAVQAAFDAIQQRVARDPYAFGFGLFAIVFVVALVMMYLLGG